MKYLAMMACIALLCSCGNSSSSNTISGNWSAALSNTDGSQALAFTTSLSQSNGSSTVMVNNLRFSTSTPCFSSDATETGSFVLSGNFNGQTQGSFQLTVQSSMQGGNLLTLQGKDQGNTVSGTWTLTGTTAGCAGSGNFTMNKM